MIDYAQLGLLFKLYSCEVLFNRGLCYIYLQQKESGMLDLNYAVKEKMVEDHNVIDEAIREEAEVSISQMYPSMAALTGIQGYTVFSIPVGVVYRPNEAKVRNLKTKDYLGKARLVAASDRSNAFTGFAGSEIKAAGRGTEKDDRPQNNISFAATNLVKPGLQSRRQQSEPPNANGRNAFPPTPPPENDKPALSRGASVRNGPKPMPAKLNIPDSNGRSTKYEKTTSPRQEERKMPTRAASEARSPPQRSYSRAEQPPKNRGSREQDDGGYPDDVYDMYSGGSNSGGGARRSQGSRRTQQRYIEEEEEGSEYDSFDEGDFEMVSNRRPGGGPSSMGSVRGGSKRPEIRKVRVKVHADDVRYIMIGTAIEYIDLEEKVRDKFGLQGRFKIKVRDEDAPQSDMITMGDQDDMDMVMMSVKSMARKKREDIGKMEVSLSALLL